MRDVEFAGDGVHEAPMKQGRTNAGRVRAGPVLLLALAVVGPVMGLAGCNTVTRATSEDDDSGLAASPANIASLSDVVQRNPTDPQAYKKRRTGPGRGGR